MQKMKKLTDTHYIVVDDSEIEEDDWCYSVNNGLIVKPNKKAIDTINSKPMEGIKFLKITHSTQPLEGDEFTSWFDYIKPLSLSEVEEAINGYSVEKMAEEYLQKWRSINNIHLSNIIHAERCKNDYKAGFKAHQELVKDKLFTVKDMKKAFEAGENSKEDEINGDGETPFEEFIQLLLPPTEWDCEIDEQGKIKIL